MLVEALQDTVDRLVAGNVRATFDPRNLAVPGALVVVESADPAGQCVYDVDLEIVLVAPGPANGDAIRTLDALAAAAEAALGPHAGDLVAYEHPTTGDVLAAWRIRRTTTVHTA